MTPGLLFTLMRRSARAARPELDERTGESVVRYSPVVRGVGWGILGLGAVSAVVVLPQLKTRHDILVAGISSAFFC